VVWVNVEVAYENKTKQTSKWGHQRRDEERETRERGDYK